MQSSSLERHETYDKMFNQRKINNMILKIEKKLMQVWPLATSITSRTEKLNKLLYNRIKQGIARGQLGDDSKDIRNFIEDFHKKIIRDVNQQIIDKFFSIKSFEDIKFSMWFTELKMDLKGFNAYSQIKQ